MEVLSRRKFLLLTAATGLSLLAGCSAPQKNSAESARVAEQVTAPKKPITERRIRNVRVRQLGERVEIQSNDKPVLKRAASVIAEVCDAYGKPSSQPDPSLRILYVSEPECAKSEEVFKKVKALQS